MTIQENHGKMARLITNKELADLPNEWLNPKVDLRHYIQVCMTVYEVSGEIFELAKKKGVCCQVVKPGIQNGNTIDRHYVGW